MDSNFVCGGFWRYEMFPFLEGGGVSLKKWNINFWIAQDLIKLKVPSLAYRCYVFEH